MPAVNNLLYFVHRDGLEPKFDLVSVLQRRLSTGAETGISKGADITAHDEMGPRYVYLPKQECCSKRLHHIAFRSLTSSIG